MTRCTVSIFILMRRIARPARTLTTPFVVLICCARNRLLAQNVLQFVHRPISLLRVSTHIWISGTWDNCITWHFSGWNYCRFGHRNIFYIEHQLVFQWWKRCIVFLLARISRVADNIKKVTEWLRMPLHYYCGVFLEIWEMAWSHQKHDFVWSPLILCTW